MMDLAPILTGIAVAGLICQATAVPVPFKVEAILPQAEGAPYATMAAQIGKDMRLSVPVQFWILQDCAADFRNILKWHRKTFTPMYLESMEILPSFRGQALIFPV